jgi:class 3 adenylate cyclase
VAINPRLGGLHHRAGLATGPLVRAVVGHSQSQKLTLLGYPIAVASALCNSAPRDCEAVVVSAETWSGLEGKSRGEKLADGKLGKAAAFTGEAWMLEGLA